MAMTSTVLTSPYRDEITELIDQGLSHRKEVLPHVDGDRVQYVGEADWCRKRELFAGARCLLATIAWPEPFGLFMVEAMACGTPVVAFPEARHRKSCATASRASSSTPWTRW